MTAAENKTFVQNIMEARSRRDPAPFIAAMADDFVWRIIDRMQGYFVSSAKAPFQSCGGGFF
jgi:hypothetical protein